ncbi:MAG: hypothetical protein V3V28_14130 [Polaribacter sp.]|uniref:hypothetical protein n=1 Tax=Polaribacter sp. TaxID=1920175 RepID=UPI002F35B72C
MKRILITILLSCSKEKFDSKKRITSDVIYEGARAKMINNLIENHLDFRMSYSEIKKKFGNSINKDSLILNTLLKKNMEKLTLLDINFLN